jgi:WD40 repeat protein
VADGGLIAETAGNFQSAACSPDGKYLVTASLEKAKIWELSTGELFGELKGHANSYFSAVYSPGGKHLLTACFDYSGGTVKIWNTADGKLVKEFVKKPMILNLAIYSPACPDDPAGGKYIAIASSDRMVRIRSAMDEKLVRELKHADWINTVDFSPDGKYVVTASRNDTARIWDIADGTLHAVLTGHSSWVNSAAYSPDGRFIVTSSLDKTAIIWNAADGKLLTRLEGHALEVNSAAFSPDGRFIVTSSNDNTPGIWSAANGKLITTLQGHKDNVNTAVFSPDGKYIVTASWENTAMIWSVGTPSVVAVTGKPLK